MIEEKVRQLIETELSNNEIILDKVEYLKEDGNNFLRITIDNSTYVDIDTCVLASRIIDPILDNANLIKESYVLDVTSKERGDSDER